MDNNQIQLERDLSFLYLGLFPLFFNLLLSSL